MLKKWVFVKKESLAPTLRSGRGTHVAIQWLGDDVRRSLGPVGGGAADGAEARDVDAGRRQGALIDASAVVGLPDAEGRLLLARHGRHRGGLRDRGLDRVGLGGTGRITTDGPGGNADALAVLVADALAGVGRRGDAARAAADLDRGDAFECLLVRRRRDEARCEESSGRQCDHTKTSTLHVTSPSAVIQPNTVGGATNQCSQSSWKLLFNTGEIASKSLRTGF